LRLQKIKSRFCVLHERSCYDDNLTEFFPIMTRNPNEKIVDKSIITMSIRCHYGWDVWTRMLYFEVTWCQIKKHWRWHSFWFNEWDCCCWFVLFGELLDCKLIYLEIRCSWLWSVPKLHCFQFYVHILALNMKNNV